MIETAILAAAIVIYFKLAHPFPRPAPSPVVTFTGAMAL